MFQRHTHLTTSIPLDTEEYRKEDGTYVMASGDPLLGIQRFLENGLANPENCLGCGGITPQLSFTYKGKEYYFTCYKIEEKGKVIAQTDYELLGSYSQRMKRDKKE